MEFNDPRLRNADGLLGWFTSEVNGNGARKLMRNHGNAYTPDGQSYWKRSMHPVSEYELAEHSHDVNPNTMICTCGWQAQNAF